MTKKAPASTKYSSDKTREPPFETKKLREGLRKFLKTEMVDPISEIKVRVGSYKFGVYAFYDYDGEPIYIGQTCEKLSSRISRHLTNQRTDAVAMSVLDPFEVYEIEVWPLPELNSSNCNDPGAKAKLNVLEATVFQKALRESKFGAVLNEKEPESANAIILPSSIRGRVVDDAVYEIRNHPDTRLARRAATLARLAQVISERDVGIGLRKTLLTQAKRLQWLAERRYEYLLSQSTTSQAKPDDAAEV